MAICVRFGGIAAFAAVLAFGLAVGLHAAGIQSKVVDNVLPLVLAGALVPAFWTTKRLFNAHNYRRADIAIFGFIALFVGFALVGLADQAGWVGSRDIVSSIVLVAACAASFLFAIRAKGFAPRGGGIWTVIATLYRVAAIAMIPALLIQFVMLTLTEYIGPAGLLIMMVYAVNFLILYPLSIAAVIVHAIGLVAGAGKMEAAP